MISPYVRRLRLSAEIKALRERAGMTSEMLSKKVGHSRPDISRLENGHTVDQGLVMKILDACEVDGDRWTEVMRITREAAETGWWDSARNMGERQALFANLEAGATTIRDYQQIFIPGLLQTPEFARARTDPNATLESLDGATPDGVVDGRMQRQRMFHRPDGPTLEAIVDELAIRRQAASPSVVKQQLEHAVSLATSDPKITLRVLPIDAVIKGYASPRTSFSIFTYPDPGDPVVVAITTTTRDLFLTDPDHVAPYVELFDRLRQQTLPGADGLELITQKAARLTDLSDD